MTRTQKIMYVARRMMKEFNIDETPTNTLAILTAMRDEAECWGTAEENANVAAIDKLIATL